MAKWENEKFPIPFKWAVVGQNGVKFGTRVGVGGSLGTICATSGIWPMAKFHAQIW